MSFPSRDEVQRVREMYPVGCRVVVVVLGREPFSRLKPGDCGMVTHVDDIGTVFVNWDCGSGLGMVYKVDHIRRI